MLADSVRFAKTVGGLLSYSQHAGAMHTAMIPDRLAELLAVRAVAGLSADEARELEELLTQHPEVDEHEHELAIAALQLQPLPESLRARLLRQAARETPPRLSGWGRARWWIAAILLAATIIWAIWRNR